MIYLLSTHYQDIYYIIDKKIFVSFHKNELHISFVLRENDLIWINSEIIDYADSILREEYISPYYVRNKKSIQKYTYSMLETILLDKIIDNI